MEFSKISIVETILFASGDDGLSLDQISEVIELNKRETRNVMKQLAVCYQDVNRGIQLIEEAGIYKLATKKELNDYIQKLVETPSFQALSQPALEILAMVAYKQPVSRLEIEAIRGVKSESQLHKLVLKGLVKEVGRSDGVGRAKLYGTTKEFLNYFGLKTLKELPNLGISLNDFVTEEDTDLFNYKYQEDLVQTLEETDYLENNNDDEIEVSEETSI